MLQMIVMLKRTNSNLSPGYAFISSDIIVHKLLEMVFMLKQLIQTYHTVIKTSLLINNIRNYSHLSEMTLVRPTNSGPLNKPWVSCHI